MAETFSKTVFTAATTGTSDPVGLGVYDTLEGVADWSTGVSAGVVTFEWAPDPAYAGTWEVLFTLGPPSSPPVPTHDSINVVGGYFRARISTTVVGGTVTVSFNLQIRGK